MRDSFALASRGAFVFRSSCCIPRHRLLNPQHHFRLVREHRLRIQLEINGRNEAFERCSSVRKNFRNKFSFRLFPQKFLRRHGINRLRYLPELDCHRLVVHERLVFRREFGKVVGDPSSDAAVTSHNLAVFINAQAVVDVAFEIVEHSAEDNHALLRFLPVIPGVEKGFGRGHRRERAAAVELAPLGGEKPPALGLARVIEGAAQTAERAGDFLPAFRAFLGHRPAAVGVADFVADIDHRTRGEQKGVEARVQFDAAVGQSGEEVAFPRTIGVHIPVLRGEGLCFAVRPAVVVGVPVCRVFVGSAMFHSSPSQEALSVRCRDLPRS